ncbi:MAG: histidinol dehydrogenase [Proteobacteria bacterium]|nr:histidinol dehydrogenase [Pseudomonadota bacterium]
MKKVVWNNLSNIERTQLLKRCTRNEGEAVYQQVFAIINQVRNQGDEALYAMTREFDKVNLSDFKVSDDELSNAAVSVTSDNLQAINFAIQRIMDYTEFQLPQNSYFNSQDGITLERLWRPISKVGLYVPGGSASLISTLMMLAIPAKVAGCSQIVLCTPPSKTGTIAPELLAAAKACGVSQIFKLGGAQAIAAMAYGTPTVPKVDKIFGPGNRFVTQAKILCSQDLNGASMDLPAGPSEIVVIADETANPAFIAADLLSQAEHDSASQVLLITTSAALVEKVLITLNQQLESLPRKTIASEALKKSAAIIVENIAQAIAICNDYGPEHLSLQIKQPRQCLDQLQNVGTVFIGQWTPETLGDYVTGANHVLPTAGAAKTFSGLSVLDFMKMIGVQEATWAGFNKLAKPAQTLAGLEQLQAHELAVTIRQEVKPYVSG